MEHSQSESAFQEACRYIPGGVDSPVRAFGSVGGTPPFIERGEGGYLFDIDGNRYIDYVQSWGPLIFGHCDDRIDQAVMEAVRKGLSFGAPTLLETELAREIDTLFESIDQVRFVSSGTEAVMSAVRLARGVTGRDYTSLQVRIRHSTQVFLLHKWDQHNNWQYHLVFYLLFGKEHLYLKPFQKL